MLVLLTAAGTVRAQTYALTEAPQGGSYQHIQITTKLAGEIKLLQDGKTIRLKQSVSATHDFFERVLRAPGGNAEKAARHYKTAQVTIAVADDRSERTLRPERSLLVAQRQGDRLMTYSPHGPLTREELDVTEHLDTLALAGLLPGKDVSVGETWKLSNPVAAALCHLDALVSHDLNGKLEQVKEDVAQLTFTGSASGIEMGATVKLKVQATARFELKARRLVALEWQQSDEREQGPVSPAAASELTVQLTRAQVEPVNELNDFALVPVPTTPQPPEAMLQLAYRDPEGRYELTYGREWHLVGRTEQHLVLRLLDRGDFVAQATLTPWKKLAAGKHLDAERFKELIAQTPGWEQEKVLQDEEVPAPKDYWIYRLAAEGQVEGLKALQYFYLIAGPQGDHLLVAFTMTPAQAQKLDTRDLNLVRSLRFPDSRAEGPQVKSP
jgi:hypothetical protein